MDNDENTTCNIRVNNAYKRYGEKNVINGLNMNIKKNCIYGLLGSSGCGKSVILQCILGIIQLDSGKVEINVDTIADIGYMPQDICLDDSLTVQESLEYYGSLYKMSKEKIKSRMDELSKLLQLSFMNNYIKNLSGGESRRVSLAISLLHDPKIIILDEPTVGIDTLLKQQIWTTFKKMVQQQKTIILTTHYIEEANEAAYVGLMRNGKIVEEGSPRDILHKYNTNTLESVFLKICYNQINNQMIQNDNDNIELEIRSETISLTKNEKLIDYIRLKTLIKKYIRVTLRDYCFLIFVFILQIIIIFLFHNTVGSNLKHLNLAIKSDEVNYFDCQNYKHNGCIFNEGFNQKTSCLIMNYFASLDYNMILVDNNEEGKKKMKNSNYIAYINFPHNFTKDLSIWMDSEGNHENLQVYVDTSNYISKNSFTKDLFESYNLLIENVLKGCEKNPNSKKIPFRFETIVGKEIKSYTNSIMTSFQASIIFCISGLYSMSMLLTERMNGILSRSMFAGVTALELVISLFFITNMFLIIYTSISSYITFVYYSYPIIISNALFLYLVQLVLLGWISFFLGIISACIMPSMNGPLYFFNALNVTQFLLSGIIWPLEAIPWYLKSICQLLPLSVNNTTIAGILLKGWSFDHPSIIIGVIIMITYTILIIFVLFLLNKYKKNMWIINK